MSHESRPFADPPRLSAADRGAVMDEKLRRLRSLLAGEGYDAAVLSWRRNAAWLTAGADTRVADVTELGVASFVVTAEDVTVVTASNEVERLLDEELDGLTCTVHVAPWYAEPGADATALHLVHGRVATDRDLEPAMTRLRARLVPIECERLRWIGECAARAMRATMESTAIGDSENVIAARLRGHLATTDLQAPVLLVAADDRIARYRHPIPTGRHLARSLMLVAAAERWGLHVALTRMGWFGGEPDRETSRRLEAARRIANRMTNACVPGAQLAAILAEARAAYREEGFPDEWQLHHQGGTIGYWARETVAVPGSDEALEPAMAVAWNPSITGVKVEDTFLVGTDRCSLVTSGAGAPSGETESGVYLGTVA